MNVYVVNVTFGDDYKVGDAYPLAFATRRAAEEFTALALGNEDTVFSYVSPIRDLRVETDAALVYADIVRDETDGTDCSEE